jgi:hypothetical protein
VRILHLLLSLFGYRSYYMVTFQYSCNRVLEGTADADMNTPGFLRFSSLPDIREGVRKLHEAKIGKSIDQIVILNIHRFWI